MTRISHESVRGLHRNFLRGMEVSEGVRMESGQDACFIYLSSLPLGRIIGPQDGAR